MIRMAARNLVRNRRRSLLTLLTMTGGFVLAAFSIAWSDGTYNEVIRAFTGSRLGHVQIHRKGYLDKPTLYATVDDLPRIREALDRNDAVLDWAPRLFAYGLGSVRDRSAAVRIVGVDPVREDRAFHFRRKLTTGHGFSGSATREAVLGGGLARRMKAAVGDELVIVSQGADGSMANDAYTVVGMLTSGDPNADRMDVYLPLQSAQELMVLPGRVHEVAIRLHRLQDARAAAKGIAAALHAEDLVVDPWQQVAAAFYRAMQTDRKGNWISLSIILLIVAVGVLNTVLMSVLERRHEFGVLLALGTRPGRLVWLVLTEAALLAAMAVVIGVCIGVPLNAWVSVHGIAVSEPFTYAGITFQVMRTELNIPSFAIPGVVVTGTAVLVALIPAVMAARTDPARSMRFH